MNNLDHLKMRVLGIHPPVAWYPLAETEIFDLIRVAQVAQIVADHRDCPYRDTLQAALAPLQKNSS